MYIYMCIHVCVCVCVCVYVCVFVFVCEHSDILWSAEVYTYLTRGIGSGGITPRENLSF